jgi:hypothetical protein
MKLWACPTATWLNIGSTLGLLINVAKSSYVTGHALKLWSEISLYTRFFKKKKYEA